MSADTNLNSIQGDHLTGYCKPQFNSHFDYMAPLMHNYALDQNLEVLKMFTITEIPNPSGRVFTALSLVNVFVTHKGKAMFCYELRTDFTPQNYVQLPSKE